MSFRIIYTHSYLKRAAKFVKRHPELLPQYEKTLKLLELNPRHPSLRLHRLTGPLRDLHSVSITYKLSHYPGVFARGRQNRPGQHRQP